MSPYYQKQNATLFQGNCLDVLKHLDPESVDMVFADPPYRLSNNGISCQNGHVVSVNKGEWDKSEGVEKDFHFHEQWIRACQKVLKPQGTIWISGTYHSIYACGFLLQRLGFKILNDICWFKPNAAPNMGCRCFTASHETLLWAKKDPKAKHIFHYDLMKNNVWPGDDIKKHNKQMRSVWQISTPKKSEITFGKHPTQKPLALLKRIILASTNKGDLILDPFTGSSTTGVIALELERSFVGIDVNRDYLDLSIKRFEHLHPQHESFL